MTKGQWLALAVVVVAVGGLWLWMRSRASASSTPASAVEARSRVIDSDTPIRQEDLAPVGSVTAPPPATLGRDGGPRLTFDPGAAA